MVRSGSKESVQDSSVGEEQPEICPSCNVEVPVAPDYVIIWLKQAEVDAKEAKRNKSQTHALYWVQQSVEKLVKARLLAYGGCYCDAVAVRHESLRGFLDVTNSLLQNPKLRDLVDKLSESDSQQRLEGARTLVDDEAMRLGISIWPPEALKLLLDNVSHLERQREALHSKAMRSASAENQSRPLFYEWLTRAVPTRFKRQVTDIEEVMAGIQSLLGICNHQLMGLSVDAKSLQERLRWAVADVLLFVLASATFPHATSSRYPAHPSAPDDLEEAAAFRAEESGRAKLLGGLGSQHYSNRIGVIYYVRRLAEEAETVAKSMQEWLLSLGLDCIEQLPTCTECVSTENR